MSRGVIRVGDRTSHGGRVVSGCDSFTVDGKGVALLGDLCTCPLHGQCRIIEGYENYTVNGKPVAYHGHKTACGAVLLSSCTTYTIEPGGGMEEAFAAGAAAGHTSEYAAHPAVHRAVQASTAEEAETPSKGAHNGFDLSLLNTLALDGLILEAGLPYSIANTEGIKLQAGTLDADLATDFVQTDVESPIVLRAGHEGWTTLEETSEMDTEEKAYDY